MFSYIFDHYSAGYIDGYCFQDPATPMMEGIIDLHHHIMFFIILVFIFVVYLALSIVYRFWYKRYLYSNRGFRKNPFLTLRIFFYSLFFSNMSFEERIKGVKKFFNNKTFTNFFIWGFLKDFEFLIPFKFRNKIKIRYFNDKFLKLFIDNYTHIKYNYFQFYCYLQLLRRRQFIDTINETRSIRHNSLLEIVWVFIPSIIIGFILVPSLFLLFSLDEFFTDNTMVTIKVIGNQWYWSYEKGTGVSLFPYTINSYMISEEDLEEGGLRLLEVDRPLKLPLNTTIRLLITSYDVLHSWAVPSLGVKMDAVPGRLNQVIVYIKREGPFYGQCSEICGVNHGFMPIKVETVPAWVPKLFEHAMDLDKSSEGRIF